MKKRVLAAVLVSAMALGLTACGGSETAATTAAATTAAATTAAAAASETTAAGGSTSTDGETLWGDANCDGKVTVADATAILQAVANKDKFELKAKGKVNADVVDNGDGITAKDALAIQMIDAKLIKQADLPITSAKLESLKG